MLVTVVNQSLPLDFVTFNREWICKVDKDDLHTLLGYKSLVTLLDDCACKVLSKLDRCKDGLSEVFLLDCAFRPVRSYKQY